MSQDEKDCFYDLYKETKLTKDEIRQFKGCEGLSDEDLERLSDEIFDLAIVAQKIITEQNG